MFLNSWSLGLTLAGLIILFLGGFACRTAVRVLRYWDPHSDSNLQIKLENEIWLASTLVEYGLGFQILTVVLFVLAADTFCQVIVGAMCATGALLANNFGMPALLIKLVGVFVYGFWIVLHKLDISSETYPLVRIKYIYLLLLLPLLVADIILQTLYISFLSPDIITSCCAVVFGSSKETGRNLLEGFSRTTLLALYYGSIIVLTGLGYVLLKRWLVPLAVLFSTGWIWFLALATVAIISVFSSYIYAMPYHHCPFCILKPEYHYIGFALYFTLIPASFFGLTTLLVEPFKKRNNLAGSVQKYQQTAIRISLLLLLFLAVISSYHYLVYRISGGE
ncbi:MAG: hypothetical protein AMJ61_14315 [Desulfobacterales bacterium SG8_35_2]|nr:MAG: hypothetical protein AMJ61_14315 [Desulfobacterales bacterium SG8_35_2]